MIVELQTDYMHDGKLYKEGQRLEMSEEKAQHLIKIGAATPAESVATLDPKEEVVPPAPPLPPSDQAGLESNGAEQQQPPTPNGFPLPPANPSQPTSTEVQTGQEQSAASSDAEQQQDNSSAKVHLG